jgi:GT2 family glycosyltransferase
MKIQAVTVCYNTPDLLRQAVTSVKRFYPKLPIFIIDGSDYNSPCFQMCELLQSEFDNIRVRHFLRNIGHGAGLDYAIRHTESEFILLMDSDIRMDQPCLEDMIAKLPMNALGIGQVYTVNKRGFVDTTGCDYVHPFFALLRRANYDKCKPVKNHGAPLIDTMWSARRKRLKVIPYDLQPYRGHKVWHRWKGTRDIHKLWYNDL